MHRGLAWPRDPRRALVAVAALAAGAVTAQTHTPAPAAPAGEKGIGTVPSVTATAVRAAAIRADDIFAMEFLVVEREPTRVACQGITTASPQEANRPDSNTFALNHTADAK